MRGSWGVGAASAIAMAMIACGEQLAADQVPDLPPRDGGTDTGADAPSGPCTGGWDEPKKLPGVVNETPATMPRITKDGLRLYFGRQGDATTPWSLWMARRAARGEEFVDPRKLDLATTQNENVYDSAVTSDERAVFFTAQAKGASTYAIGRATLENGVVVKSERLTFAGIDAPVQQNPFIEGTTLWFLTAPNNVAPPTLHRAALDGSNVGTPTVVPLSSPPVFRNPVVIADGTRMLVAAFGPRLTIQEAAFDGAAFSSFAPLPIANATADEAPGSMDVDDCTLYFLRREVDFHSIWTVTRRRN